MAARAYPPDRELARVVNDVYRPRFPSTEEAKTGVPDDIRWAIEVLRAAAPDRRVDEGHYANRALTYLERIEKRFRARHEYASPAERRKAYDDVYAALRELTKCWVREEIPTEEKIDAANTGLAILAVLANVPLEREMRPRPLTATEPPAT